MKQKTSGKEIKIQDGKLMFGDYVVNDNYEIPDLVKEIAGGTTTIFMNDVRVTTNVINGRGERAIGTKLQGPAHDAIFRDGKLYRGEPDILGTKYFTSYDPIKNSRGEIVGVAYVGIKKSEFYEQYNKVKYLILLLSAVLIMLSTGVVIWNVRKTLRPLVKMDKVIAEAATGNLTTKMDYLENNEIGTVAKSLNHMLENMRVSLARVLDTSSQVSGAASHLNTTSEQIATGSEEVAAQASTVATASEEMAATSMEIAGNCARAAESSRHATEAAKEGYVVVQNTIEGMNRIAGKVKSTARVVEGLGARSDQIGEIVGTIEDIADQTNLLALNAAIEAARAGDQGRGFAVVADEVRALAVRTTNATKEITDMIRKIQTETREAVIAMGEGVKDVARGTEDANKSGEALRKIMTEVDEVGNQINQIAIAAEQQTATTSEISSNIMQVTEVVNGTVMAAQECANDASKLANAATDMQNIVNKFTI
jgi:methyl-accepting chemotaxis protein